MPFSEAVDSRVLLDAPARHAGRARRRPGAARPHRAPGGRGAGGRGLLGLPPPRGHARALRHRGAEPGLGAPVAAPRRPGPRRADRRDRRADQHQGRLAHPRLPLPARDRRGGPVELPRRADPAPGRGPGRAGGAEPRAARLQRRRDLRARGRRHGDRRDGRARRLRRPGRHGRGAAAQAALLRARPRRPGGRRRGHRRAARAADRGQPADQRRPGARAASGSSPASRRCAPRSTRCWPPTTSTPPASTATC